MLRAPWLVSETTSRLPWMLAVTWAVPLLLMASTTSLRVSVRERSMADEWLPESVMTILPRETHAPPLRSERATSLSRRAWVLSKVKLVAPTAEESRLAKPALSICWVETRRSTMNE